MKKKRVKLAIGIEGYERVDEIVRALKKMYEIEVVHDSEEAYHSIHVFKPDIAVLDFSLSKIHPIELYEGIALAHPTVNFVLCVTEDNLKIAEKIWKKRSIDFIVKPYSPQQFIHNINTIVRNILSLLEIEQLKSRVETLEKEARS